MGQVGRQKPQCTQSAINSGAGGWWRSKMERGAAGVPIYSYEPGTPLRSWSPDREKLWTDNTVVEADPPRRLVHTWRSLYDDELASEEESRVTWEIEPQEEGYSKLTLVHDQLEGAPKTAERVAGGWLLIISGLKTLVETGAPLTSSWE